MPHAAMTLSLRATMPLAGTISVQGDKSLAHRAALFAALADGESCIDHFPDSGVSRAMLNALTSLGMPWSLKDGRLTVTGRGLRGFQAPAAPISCGNSATTLRMLAGALAASGVGATLDGSPGLRQRPMARITLPLREMGAAIEPPDGRPPLTLASRGPETPLQAISHTLPVSSAQVKSCLILAALAGDGLTTLREPDPSRDHTERLLAAMGAKIATPEPGVVSVAPLTQPLTPLQMRLPGDMSSAAFLLVAAALVPGSSILARDVGVNPTRTGLLDVLAEMGLSVRIENPREVAGEPVGDIRVVAAPLRAVRVSGPTVVRMIDEFPAFAVAACFAQGVTEVRDAEELRYKESDRIGALCHELRRIGAQVEEHRDGFSIQGSSLAGGVCEARGDHRLAMSLALAGLASTKPVQVEHAEILNESFPDFTQHLRALGATALESRA